MKRRSPSIDRDSFQKQIVSNWFRCGPLEAPPRSKTFRFLLNLMMNHRRTPSSSSLASQSNVNLEGWGKERLSFIMFCKTFKKEAAVVSLIVRPGSRTHIAGELIKALLLLSGVSYSWFYYMLPCCWWLSVFPRVRILVLSLPCRIIPIHSYSMDWQFLICIFTASRACPFCLHLSLLLFVRISLYCTGSFHFQVQSQSGGKKVNLSLKLTATITTGRVSSPILLLYIECWPLLLNSLTAWLNVLYEEAPALISTFHLLPCPVCLLLAEETIEKATIVPVGPWGLSGTCTDLFLPLYLQLLCLWSLRTPNFYLSIH